MLHKKGHGEIGVQFKMDKSCNEVHLFDFIFVIINGAACGNIIPTRGFQQGDPLSPTLFLICTEGLSALIYRAAQNQCFTGISICSDCPRVTHLLFTDDNILFYKASAGESRELRYILQKYEEASGQKINTNKSSISSTLIQHKKPKMRSWLP